MERCDFSSISTCLKNQISESNQMNQPDFLYELFEDFMNDPINEDFSMDNGLICRWITGQAKNQSQNNLILCKTQQSEKTGNNHSAELTSLNGRLQHGYTGHLHVIHTGRYDFGYKKAGTCISI